jgi:hypothetical protein
MTTRHPTANASQRARRARIARIDYYPSSEALALIESRRTRYGPTHNNSGIIDTIIAEWAVLAGLKQSEIDKPETSANLPGLSDNYARARMTSDARSSTRARETWDAPAKCPPARMGVSAAAPEFIDASMRASNSGSLPTGANQARVICGARRRRDGEPCQGLSVPGKVRCKWHGGASTGPRTEEGRKRSMSNLRQYRDYKTALAKI